MKNNSVLRNQTIYQVYVRNYSKEGTFKALENDLPRIKDLGVSILYLLPIHPIGEVARKGIMGCPYSIKDYRAIAPELGTMDDFVHLVKKCHAMGLNVMMDIVFNHTSRDAVLVKEHPEWYVYKDGKLANRIGDWSDVADLRLELPEVQKYLIDTLVFWVKQGVDGFRCDVAPLVPLAFWKEAVRVTGLLNPNLVWLSESVEPGFIKYLRSLGYTGQSDAEMYQAFDILYDYDVFPAFNDYLAKKGTLKDYLDKVAMQETLYPADYLKIHFLENHDQERIVSKVHSRNVLLNLTAWSFFQKGVGFLYAGQETKNNHRPSLFDKEVIDLKIKDQAFYDFIKRLVELKKLPIFQTATRFDILPTKADDLIYATLGMGEETLYGVFNLKGGKRTCTLAIPDGTYLNLLNQSKIKVENGRLTVKEPLILVKTRN